MGFHSRGRMSVWEGGSLWIGETTAEIAPHAHHAVQLTLAFDADFDVEVEDVRVRARAAIVAPDAEHSFRARGRLVHLFVEPESRVGRALLKAWCADAKAAAVPSEVADAALEALRRGLDEAVGEAALAELGRAALSAPAGDVERTAAPDPRVRSVIDWAAENVTEPLTLDEAAEIAGLSPGRTRHLFVEETGVPFRTYVLWLRLMRAVRRYAEGAPLTEAAYDAGFADSAHLSRTFRRMFGTQASGFAVV